MPSRAEVRSGLETALRALSIAILAWMFWLSLDRGRAEQSVSAGSANLRAALQTWSNAGIAPDRASFQLDSTPSPASRDWMRALAHSGTRVFWKGNLPSTAVSVRPIASPRGGLRVLSAAPSANRITVSDDLGLIEGATAHAGGASFDIPSASGNIVSITGGATSKSDQTDSIRIGRILVIGSAGWESKFVVAALEEDGWKVDADMRVAPSVDVTQGATSPIDTARYSAVIALDGTAASRSTDISRYVSSGGGLILAGAATSLEAFAALRAGTTGHIQTPSILEGEPGSASLKSLALVPIVSLESDAIRLESRDGATASAARRHNSGRVLQVGYVDTWRWRMSGGENGPADHREWWTKAISSVAYAPVVKEAALVNDNAPVARLIEALGPQSQTSTSLASHARSISLWFLLAVLSLSLLGEWASRRLRGRP